MSALRIIVADPCPDNRESLALLLRLHRYSVEEADSLNALVARLRVVPVDLVIAEVFCNQDCTRRAVLDAAPGAVLAFHTVYTDPAEIRRSGELGCEHFIKATHMERLMKWLAIQRAMRVGRDSADSGSLDGISRDDKPTLHRFHLRNRLKILARSPELGLFNETTTADLISRLMAPGPYWSYTLLGPCGCRGRDFA